MLRARWSACLLQLMLSMPAAGAAASSAGPWSVADALLAPSVGGEADVAPLRDSPDVAYAACQARWRRLGAVVCAAVVPQAKGAAAQLGRGELEWRVLGVLGEGAWEQVCALARAAWRRAQGAAASAVARLDAAADASAKRAVVASFDPHAPRDDEAAAFWRRAVDGGCTALAGGLAALLGAFDSGRRAPYPLRHGVHSGSSPVPDLVLSTAPGPAALDD